MLNSPTERENESIRQARVLRALADWLDRHPYTNLRVVYGSNHYSGLDATDKQELAEELRMLGGFTKEVARDDFHFRVPITSDFEIVFYTRRDKVCTKRVVGTRMVEAKVIPEHVEPAHEEEIVEWDCPESVLSPQAERLEDTEYSGLAETTPEEYIEWAGQMDPPTKEGF